MGHYQGHFDVVTQVILLTLKLFGLPVPLGRAGRRGNLSPPVVPMWNNDILLMLMFISVLN